MRKIISLFARNYEGDHLVRDEIVPGAEWVVAGEGTAHRKWDGTACLVRDGDLYKRYDAKAGRTPPPGWEACQDPDPVTGHWPGWVLVSFSDPADRWIRKAAMLDHRPSGLGLPDGTYEACGPHIGGNAEGFESERLVPHSEGILPDVPTDFEGLRAWLAAHPIEGIVWHHADGRMVKIKRRDFGLPWPIKATPQNV